MATGWAMVLVSLVLAGCGATVQVSGGSNPVDVTTAPLPAPTVELSPTSPDSLFKASNLSAVVHTLQNRFGNQQYILAMALYPGELEAVVGSNGDARRVAVTTGTGTGSSNTLTLGPWSEFDGSRQGINIEQVNAKAVEKLTELIAARGGVPVFQLSRFELVNLPGDLAGWNIFPIAGTTYFRAHLLGDQLTKITATGSQQLN